MKSVLRYVMLYLLLTAGHQAFSQTDSTVTLPPVSITDQHTLAPAGYKILRPDSITLSQEATGNLADVLAIETAIYLRSYGSGGLSTVSFRGMGTNHTRLLWNDLPINSSMNGTVDLNLLPINLFSNVEVQYGNGSLLTGSGGIGGGIQLISAPDWSKRIKLNVVQEFSSFNTYKTAARFAIGNKKWQSITGFVFNKAKNDFAFKNTAQFGSPEQVQQHAEFLQYGGVQEIYGKLKHGHEIALKGFVTWSDRNIPPTMLTSDSREGEKDLLLLASAEWKFHKGIHYFRDNVNYKFDIIKYTNGVASIGTNDRTHTVQHVFSYMVQPLRQLTISARMENQVQFAQTTSYNGGNKHQAVNGLYASAKYVPINQLELLIAVRQELVDTRLSPFLPSLAVNMPVQQLGLKLYANGYRNYRNPTLNDRYWSVGGNPDLKQENAWGAEGGVAFEKQLAKDIIKLDVSASGFSMWVDNWIVWLPGISSIWTPRNVLKVHSKGMEAHVKLTATPGRWLLMFISNYQYSIATVTASEAGSADAVGKDLIYTPRQIGNITARADFRGWYLNYTQFFTGERYTTSDNEGVLKAFTTADIRVGKSIHKYVPGLEIYFALSNLWNATYQNIAWRAMPGRAYTVGIHYNFNKPQTP